MRACLFALVVVCGTVSSEAHAQGMPGLLPRIYASDPLAYSNYYYGMSGPLRYASYGYDGDEFGYHGGHGGGWGGYYGPQCGSLRGDCCRPKCGRSCKPRCDRGCRPKCHDVCKPRCPRTCRMKCDRGCGRARCHHDCCADKCHRGCGLRFDFQRLRGCCDHACHGGCGHVEHGTVFEGEVPHGATELPAQGEVELPAPQDSPAPPAPQSPPAPEQPAAEQTEPASDDADNQTRAFGFPRGLKFWPAPVDYELSRAR